MKTNLYAVGFVVGVAGLCVGLLPAGNAQQSTPSQPPRPSNPQPRPVTPKGPDSPGSPVHPVLPPGPTNPTTPSNPNDPNNPGRTNNPNDPNNPGRTNNPNDPNSPNRTNPSTTRNARPFAFQNPTDEARFNEGSQKLVRMEQRFDQSNQTLLKRLGEIRQMTPERQSGPTMDLLQQMLKSQTDMQQYLVSSRSLWTGDVDASGQPTDGTQQDPHATPPQPAQQQPAAPRQPTNPPSNPPR